MSAGDWNPEGWIFNDAFGWTRRETTTAPLPTYSYTYAPRLVIDFAEPLETLSGTLPDLSRGQAASPVITPDASGRYDLVPFLRGNGEAYLTRNTWASDEIMWTENGATGIWFQRKNAHSEEFGLTPSHILRGIDDSPGKGEAYVLTNPDGSQGSPWSPRWMRPGDLYKRTAIVRYYDLTTGALRKEFTHITWLKFVAYHASWASQYGVVLPNVIEMEAYSDKNGAPGALFERYKYAHGLGLVYWSDGALKVMGIAERRENLPKTPRMTIGWYNGLVLPKSLISASDVRFKRHVLKAAGVSGFNVRSAPKAGVDYNIITTLEAVKDFDCDAIPRETLTAAEKSATAEGDKTWHIVRIDGVVGYVRSDAGTVTLYVPPVEPPPPPPPNENEARNKLVREHMDIIVSRVQRMNEDAHVIGNSANIIRSMYEVIEPQAVKSGILSSIAQFVKTIRR